MPATKMVPGLQDLPYPDRLKVLDLPTLVYRRMRGDVIQAYKIIRGIDDVSIEDFFTPSPVTQTRGHKYKLTKPRARTKLRGNSFTHRIVDVWNALPEEVVKADSLNSFKNLLDKHWEYHPNRFYFNA